MANIFLLAPAPNMQFASLPSGSTYVSDANGLVQMPSGNTVDLIALVVAGCRALAPLSSMAQFQTLTALYAQDVAAPYPLFTTAIVTNDGTPANDGYWQKTSGGAGSGNWTQLQQGQISTLITQEATNATNIAANGASISALQTRAASDESAISGLQSSVATIQSTLASAITNVTQQKFPANGAANVATTTTLPTYAASGSGASLALTATSNGAFPTTDGVAAAVNNRVLVKNETGGNQPYNQLYTLTQLGTGSTPWILSIASDANTPAVVNGLSVFVAGGTINGNQAFTQIDTIATIGTSNALWQHSAGGLGVRTSMFQQASNPFTAADIAAAAIGGTAILDTAQTYSSSSNYTTTAPWRFENSGALTISGSGNVTFAQAPSYDRFANPYDQIFVYSSTGRALFSYPGEISPVWWGANWQGSTTFATEQGTTRALQYAVYAMDGAGPHSLCTFPPGVYAFAAGTSQAAAGSANSSGSALYVYSRYMRFRAKAPGTVRWFVDPTSVITGASHLGFFLAGSPNFDGSGSQYGGTMNSSFIATTGGGPICSGCNFVGAFDPTKVEFDFLWENLDYVFNPTPYSGTFLGSNRKLVPVYRQGSFRALFSNSSFYGAPNDGFYVLGSGTAFRCKGVNNGFYGGATNGDSTRNGFTIAGWMDLLTPGLVANKISLIECETIANANTGMAVGAMAQHVSIYSSTDNGSNAGIEHILAGGDIITQWAPSYTVVANQLMYVPGSATGCPAGLGGLVFQCTSGAGGVTSPSLPGAMSSATVGQSGISDGSVTWQCIGYMPANGRVSSTVTRARNLLDGAIPTGVFYPYGIGEVSAPTKVTGNGVNGAYSWVLNSANENVFKSIGETVRNYGYTGNTSAPAGQVNCHNGGHVVLNDYEADSCYATANNMLVVNCSLNAFGSEPDNQARVWAKVRFRNPQGTAAFAGLFGLSGNLNCYDLEIDHDASPLYYGVLIEHAQSKASTLETGRIKIRGYGTARDEIFLNWATSGSSVAKEILIEDCEAHNCNSAGVTSDGAGFLHVAASVSMNLSAKFRVRNCVASYGGVTNHPIVVNSSGNITGGLKFDVQDNELNAGSWKLNYDHGITPGLFDSTSPILTYAARNNGLPGDKETQGTTTPAAFTWRIGDRQMRRNPVASGTILDVCTADGTLSGTMSGCNVTVGNGTDNGTYTGTPPTPGDVITFSGPTNGPFAVTRADSGLIYLERNTNAATGGSVPASYASPTFKQLTLSS
jgi:hypothetical protein